MSNPFKNYYLENGYVIFKSLISNEKIEKILIELKRFKESRKFLVFSIPIFWAILTDPIFPDLIKICSAVNV